MNAQADSAVDLRAPVRLNSGRFLPRIGLGVFRASADDAYRAVRHALDVGYRHVDTAQVYGNEAAVGRAIRDSGIARDEIVVTTKLWNDVQAADLVVPACERSIAQLDIGPIDLFLLHWPVPELRLGAWRKLETLFAAGKVKSIGVSNFLVPHLQELLRVAEIVPAVNQIEVTPFLQRRDVRDLCVQHGIAVETYSPLTKGQRLDHPVVVEVARRHGRSPAQVLLRWGLQNGLVVLPKSVRPERIEENLDLFDFALPEPDMARLDALEENLVTGWNPRWVA